MGSVTLASIMNGLLVSICFALFSLTSGIPQREPAPGADLDNFEFSGPTFNFKCPEPNGLFADAEQCDLYYHCEDGRSESILCPDGLLFDDSIRNHEKCVLPHGVDCGAREFVQAKQEGIDERCERANGMFDHEDPTVCDRFYTCDNGTAHEMPCSFPLVFDVAIGACTRPEQASEEAKKCGGESGEESGAKLKTVEGFTCPGKEVIGPQGLLQAHPIFPHPHDCQFFFTCFFGKDPNKFGCPKGEVFNAESLTCKDPEEVPDCACWYDCGEDSRCPETCNADCSCGSQGGGAIDES